MTRALAALALTFAVAAQEAAPPAKPAPLPLPAAVKKDRALAAALSASPTTVRDLYLETPPATAWELPDEPLLAWRLAEFLGGAPFALEKAEEAAQWDLISGGARYVITPRGKAGDTRVVSFTFMRALPMAPGTRISGTGVAALRVHEDKQGARLDFDLYVVRGGTRADRAMPGWIFDYSRFIRADMDSIIAALDRAALEAMDDPWGILAELQEAEDLFGAGDIAAFKRIFMRPGAGGAGRK